MIVPRQVFGQFPQSLPILKQWVLLSYGFPDRYHVVAANNMMFT